MEYMLGACGAFVMLTLVGVLRLRQFSLRYRGVLAKQKSHETCTILMLDHYPGSEERGFQTYFLCVFYSIFPRTQLVILVEDRTVYAVSKLFQAILVFFDPRGWNPLSVWIRYRRRYIDSTI